jgi:hypothetical protein
LAELLIATAGICRKKLLELQPNAAKRIQARTSLSFFFFFFFFFFFPPLRRAEPSSLEKFL